jgi:AraC-like DNA-binding protein
VLSKSGERVERDDFVWTAGERATSLVASERAEILRASYLSNAATEGVLRARDAEKEPGLSAIVRLLRAELERSSRSVARALLEPFFAYLERGAGASLIAAACAPIADPHVARALAELRARPAAAWSVEALARVAGLSRAAFARRFVAELGVPPMRAVAEHRMQLAARLLVESDKSLAELAREIGYESEFAFSRAFKREHGEAPALFRRRFRAGLEIKAVAPIRAAA